MGQEDRPLYTLPSSNTDSFPTRINTFFGRLKYCQIINRRTAIIQSSWGPVAWHLPGSESDTNFKAQPLLQRKSLEYTI
jgi:hypothetical protein